MKKLGPEGWEIYRKEYSDFNYWQVILYLPIFNCGKKINMIEEEGSVYEVYFDSCIGYVSYPYWRSFAARILGFGFAIQRQTGY